MHEEKSTTDLFYSIKGIKPNNEMADFIKTNSTNISFSSYINQYIYDNNLNLKDVVSASMLESHYAYQIINGIRKNPGRNKVLALCIGASMNLSHIQRGLKISGNAILYPKNSRDIIIITHINNKIFNIGIINEALESYDEELIY